MLCGKFLYELRIGGPALVEVLTGVEFGFLSVIELRNGTVVSHDAGIDFALGTLDFATVRVEEGFVHKKGR